MNGQAMRHWLAGRQSPLMLWTWTGVAELGSISNTPQSPA
jgi:hypothetical protein